MRAGDHPSSLHTADDAKEQWVRTALCSVDACRHLAYFCAVPLIFFVSYSLRFKNQASDFARSRQVLKFIV
jgi:hypothetical protein